MLYKIECPHKTFAKLLIKVKIKISAKSERSFTRKTEFKQFASTSKKFFLFYYIPTGLVVILEELISVQTD